jgi:hypothetical protein
MDGAIVITAPIHAPRIGVTVAAGTGAGINQARLETGLIEQKVRHWWTFFAFP